MKFEWSTKLEKLFNRIQHKDSSEMAEEVFSDVATITFSTREEWFICDLLNEGASLPLSYHVFEHENFCYVFVRTGTGTEIQIRNTVLRAWCHKTNRKIKNKS